MSQRDRYRHLLGCAVLLAIACSEASAPIVLPPPSPPSAPTPFVVAPAASVVAAEQDVYISLPPDSIPAGLTVTITNRRTGGSVTTAVVSGGFDPVAIPALTGDIIAIAVQTTTSPLSFTFAVPPVIPPVVLRTDPAPHKRDVPLNASLVAVFSQPVGGAALANGSITLSSSGGAVPGHVTFADSAHISVLFVPDAPMTAETDYQLAVSTAVKNLVGSPLAAPASIPFTTGDAATSAMAVAAMSVAPLAVTIGSGGTVQLSATIKDSSGNLFHNLPVTWGTSNAAVATVSTAGVVQAIGAGSATITANYGGLSAASTFDVSQGSPGDSIPVISIAVGPSTGKIAIGSTLQLGARAADRQGYAHQVLIAWASSAPAIASVSAAGLITGVAQGTAVISASFGGVQGVATVTVTPIAPTLTFASVTVGTQQSCALTVDGVAYCWGHPGTSGTGSLVNSSVPLPVNTQLRFTHLVAGMYETCGVATDNAAYCWGSSVSRILPGMSVKAISVGGSHQCAIATSGAAYCWGFGYYGELGGDSAAFAATCPVSSSIPQPTCDTPTPVSGGLLFKSINADNVETTCGVTTSGAAYCWGDNLLATLGVGSNVGPQGCIGDELDFGPTSPVVYPCSTVPAAVTGGQLFSDVQSECGLASDSRIYCWGTNQDGILGVGSTTGPSTCGYDTPSGSYSGACSPVPVPVGGGQSSFIQLSGSDARHCGLTAAGAVYCWGRWGAWNNGGGYPYPAPSSTAPVLIGGGIVFTSIGVSGDHGCGVTAAGAIYCWGGNAWGQLGDGTTTPSAVPVKVAQP